MVKMTFSGGAVNTNYSTTPALELGQVKMNVEGFELQQNFLLVIGTTVFTDAIKAEFDLFFCMKKCLTIHFLV
jgi:hypothetical protein